MSINLDAKLDATSILITIAVCDAVYDARQHNKTGWDIAVDICSRLGAILRALDEKYAQIEAEGKPLDYIDKETELVKRVVQELQKMGG